MQLEDSKVVRIAPTFTRLESSWAWPREDIGFSEERWNQYRALFQAANIQDGLQKEEGYVFYLADGWKGFVYTTTPPKHIILNLDECKFRHKNDTCFVFLEKNWYLFKG